METIQVGSAVRVSWRSIPRLHGKRGWVLEKRGRSRFAGETAWDEHWLVQIEGNDLASVIPVSHLVALGEYVPDISTCQSCGGYWDALIYRACPTCGGYLG